MANMKRQVNSAVLRLPPGWHAAGRSQRDSKKGLILVANDDRFIRNQLSKIVLNLGYDVIVSNNGDDALAQFIQHPADLAFTGLKLHGMGGLNLSNQIKASSLNARVVLVMDDWQENILNRIKWGSFDYVLYKPIKFEDIKKTVQFLLATR
jgi:DNA-binding NtrC family response regulator